MRVPLPALGDFHLFQEDREKGGKNNIFPCGLEKKNFHYSRSICGRLRCSLNELIRILEEAVSRAGAACPEPQMPPRQEAGQPAYPSPCRAWLSEVSPPEIYSPAVPFQATLNQRVLRSELELRTAPVPRRRRGTRPRAERKGFTVSWPEACTPHMEASGIPLAAPHLHSK